LNTTGKKTLRFCILTSLFLASLLYVGTLSYADTQPRYRINNGIIFSMGDFGHLLRTSPVHTETIYIANAGKEYISVKKLSVSASSHTVVYTSNSSSVGEKRVAEKDPVKVKTNVFEKKLLPLGNVLQQLEELEGRFDEFKKNTADGKRLNTDKRKEFENLLLNRKRLIRDIESNFSTVEINLDLSYFPELKKAEGMVDISVKLELENNAGEETFAVENFALGRSRQSVRGQLKAE